MMEVDAKLLARAAELKRSLVEFSHQPRYEQAGWDAAAERELDLDELGYLEFVNFWDYFLLEYPLRGGQTVVERFVAARPDLRESERQLLLGWRDVVEGPFEVQECDGDALILVNLVDDLTYRVRSNAGPAALQPLSPGVFLGTRIVPIGDEWMLSGATSAYDDLDRDLVYEIALDRAVRTPAAVYRNPEKLALGWEIQRKHRAQFMQFFGGDLLVVPGRDVQRRMAEYRAYAQRETGNDDLYAVRSPAVEPSSALTESETVAVIYDEIEGIGYYADFGLADEAFSTPDLLRQRRHRDVVQSYLKDRSVAPLVLRRLVGRHPATAGALFQRLLKKPKFDWDRDGEALLRRYKPDFFDRVPTPSVSALSDRLAAYAKRREPQAGSAPGVAEIVNEAMQALHTKDEDGVQKCCGLLVDGSGGTGGKRAVDAALMVALQRDLTAAWRRGWQPADVVRFAQRCQGPRHARVVVDVIAAEMRAYASAAVDERWEAQLGELGATVWWERDDEYLSALGEREGLARPALIRRVLEVLYVFNTCPEIEKLGPLPGQARRGSLGAAATQERVVHQRQLDRVRALLAKAESTGFAEEAEAYTAKAQELMARYSIDYALLSVGAGKRDEPIGRRIGVDNPYEAPKVLLLDAVARANRCRSVWSGAFGFVTVLGFPSDVDGVEMLFTSLLVQATGAMVAVGSRRDANGRSSTRSFRQSFLTAYAQRIGERLTIATRDATEQASRDVADLPGAERLLPVLASREAKVDDLIDELFPDLVGKHVAVTNREGWASGRAAADRAHLNASERLTAKS